MTLVLPQHKLSPFKPPHDSQTGDILIEQVFRASNSWGIQMNSKSSSSSSFAINSNSMVEDHENVTIQRRRVLEWRSAANTDPSACHNLAIALFRGEMGVEKNPTEAAKYFTMAAKQGNVASAFNLGWQYANANGVKQSWANAVKWWTFAAELNHSSAARNIGLLYSLGMVPDDAITDNKLNSNSMNDGQGSNGSSSTNVAENKSSTNSSSQSTGSGKPNYEKAFHWYTVAANLGNWKACVALASMYRSGNFVQVSEELAQKWEANSKVLQAQQNQPGDGIQ